MTFINLSAGVLAASVCATSFCTLAFAADVLEPAGCNIMGIVEGGGLYDWQNSDVSLGGPQIRSPSNWHSGFGEIAAGVTCSDWNFQADAAYYGFWASKTINTVPPPEDVNLSARQGHVGGSVFWRDPQSMALGVSGSWVSQGYDISASPANVALATGSTGNIWRAGGFAEFYASDSLTLAASAHYFNGSLPNGQFSGGVALDQFGFEFAGIAKYYPTDDLALTARVDALRSTFRIADVANFDFNGYALSLEGEYLVPETQLSLFAGGRYADRTITLFSPARIDLQDTQAFIGVKYAFGGAAPSSIAARDRTRTYDNTSVFLEKLPSLAGSIDNTLINALGNP